MAVLTCTIDGCTHPQWCRTWCRAHYQRWRKGQNMTIPLRAPSQPPRPARSCEIENCSKVHYALGVCQYHYKAEWLAQRRGH